MFKKKETAMYRLGVIEESISISSPYPIYFVLYFVM
jgi:hypothetical protein